jgi:hypothetical protein
MLVIHAGLPKTGTTSLQWRLSASRASLQAQGWVYPEGWMAPQAPAHHLLSRSFLADDPELVELHDTFVTALANKGNENWLISSESFSLSIGQSRLAFVQWLRRCTQHGDVTILMWLRRADKFIESMYLQQSRVGNSNAKAAPGVYAQASARWYNSVLEGVAKLRAEIPSLQFQFLKHDRNIDTLQSFSEFLHLPENILAVAHVPPENRRLNLANQVFLHRFEQFSGQLQLQNARKVWVRAIDTGAADLGNGTVRDEYSIFTLAQRQQLHQQVQAAADKSGISEYRRFFGNDVIASAPLQSLETFELSEDVMTNAKALDQDLPQRIRTHLATS